MKKYILFAAALAVLAGCAKDEQKTIATEEKVQEEEIINGTVSPETSRTVTFIVDAEKPEVKGSLTLSGGFLWDVGADATRFGLFSNEDPSGSHVPSSGLTVGGDKRANVSVDVPAGTSKVYLYYGSAYNQDQSTTQPFSWFNMESTQTQTNAGTLNNTFGNMVLASDPIDVSGGETSVQATLHMLTSMICFNIYSSTPSSATVSSVSFKAANADDYIAGQVHAKFPYDNVASIYEFSGVHSNTATVNLTNSYSLSSITSKESAQGIFLGVTPRALTGYTITVTTNEGVYEFETGNAIEFKAGKVKPINLNLNSATDSPYMPKVSVETNPVKVLADATSATISVKAKNLTWTATPGSGVSLDRTSATVTTEETIDITASFAVNSTAEEVNRTVTISNNAGLSDIVVTIKQAASGASGLSYRFALSWGANADNAAFGFGNGSTGAGHYATLSSITKADGTPADLSDPVVVQEVIDEATDNLDPAGSGVAGNGAPFSKNQIKFVLCSPVGANNTDKTIALGIQTPASGSYFSKLVIYESDGVDKTIARTWYIWCP